MNAGNAITMLMNVLAANVSGINAALAGTGYHLSLAPASGADDTSGYRHIKRGDRMKLPDGLTVCFVPDSSTEVGYLTANTSEKRASVQIVAYFMNERDPDRRERARYAIADALRALYNRETMRTLVTGAGTFHRCGVGDEQFRYFERLGETKFGQVAAAVVLSWSGLYYVEETSSSG